VNPVIGVQSVVCARSLAGAQTAIEIPALTIERGTVTILSGPLGCGKNLLLRVLGLLESPDSGEVWFEEAATSKLTEEARTALRSKRCGFVFSSPFLLPGFSVIENIAMPLFKVCELEPAQAKERAEEVLNFTGLQEIATGTPETSSQEHRVALARALAGKPAAIFVEDLDGLMPPDDLGAFRDLLHAAAERFDLAVVCTATTASVPRVGERHVGLTAGRLSTELAP
jgi:lipoprotein-releasing system ATP-binding protein